MGDEGQAADVVGGLLAPPGRRWRRARAMPEWYSSTRSLAESLPSRKGCSRVPLRSKLQEVQSNEVSV